MIWTDFLIDRCPGHDEVKEALVAILNLDSHQVEVVSEVGAARRGRVPDLLCEVQHVQGDFCLRLTLYTREGWVPEPGESLVAMARLSEMLQCRCLTDDGSADPYTWLLVSGRDDYRQVRLDIDKADETNEYTLVRSEQSTAT